MALVSRDSREAIEATLYGADAVCTNALLDHLQRQACESHVGAEMLIHVPQDSSAAGILAGLTRRGDWHSVLEHPLRIWELDLATAPT
ncbi:MAG: hypothetical protein M5U22_12555 [Thermoleophilia bacterium]|nr:hypothetical protein [Thermoleophilia bacterium]